LYTTFNEQSLEKQAKVRLKGCHAILIGIRVSYRFSEEEIQAKVDGYRAMLLGSRNGNDTVKDEHGRQM
jgi:hypothetical protein